MEPNREDHSSATSTSSGQKVHVLHSQGPVLADKIFALQAPMVDVSWFLIPPKLDCSPAAERRGCAQGAREDPLDAVAPTRAARQVAHAPVSLRVQGIAVCDDVHTWGDHKFLLASAHLKMLHCRHSSTNVKSGPHKGVRAGAPPDQILKPLLVFLPANP